jgi:triosephosphate isomerase
MRALVAGNWKMNGTEDEARALLADLIPRLGKDGGGAEVAVAPPFTALRAVAEAIEGTAIALAAQDLHPASHGAFTGEISAPMLAALGVRYAIVGHSERRRLCHETDADAAAKVAAALEAGIVPILCVGEQESERMAGATVEILDRQVSAGISRILPLRADSLVIAYEPVWAIGTGRTATAAQAGEAHEAIRRTIARAAGNEAAGGVRILYGGSVTAANAATLMKVPGVDGALVGGASLVAESFAAIVAAAG